MLLSYVTVETRQHIRDPYKLRKLEYRNFTSNQFGYFDIDKMFTDKAMFVKGWQNSKGERFQFCFHRTDDFELAKEALMKYFSFRIRSSDVLSEPMFVIDAEGSSEFLEGKNYKVIFPDYTLEYAKIVPPVCDYPVPEIVFDDFDEAITFRLAYCVNATY